MTRILVTGGAGFIGSHLCERLHAQGHDIICLDNLSTGRFENIRALMTSPRFRFQQIDMREAHIPTFLTIDQVYNLACPASPVQYQRQPVATLMTSVMGAVHVAEMARRTGARVLQASTSEVYGDPLEHPQTEAYFGNVNPNGPRACYDEGKRSAETLLCDYERGQGINLRIARIFNTYGPRMADDDGRVVSQFISRALRNEDIVIHGDGAQTRSFCYVDDMVDALIALMESDVKGPVNLGNPEEITILALAETIREMTGSASRIVHRLPVADDPARRKPDITRARINLGWEPSTALRDGLARTIVWFHACMEEAGVQGRA